MLTTDFSNRPYTAEVLRLAKPLPISESLEQLIQGRWENEEMTGPDGSPLTLYHGFLASRVPHHRVRRAPSPASSDVADIPRTKEIRGHLHYLYDVLLAQRAKHVVIAVPFHDLGADFFVKVDSRLAGTRTLYETLNITKLVVHLGNRKSGGSNLDGEHIGVTRCHLSYEDPVERRRDVEQVRLSGSNLCAAETYQRLIEPVLQPDASRLRVTPVLLGIASFIGGVKKCGAISDRHGNFKVWVGPGLRQISRLFGLLESIQAVENVASATSNIPILQSGALEEME